MNLSEDTAQALQSFISQEYTGREDTDKAYDVHCVPVAEPPVTHPQSRTHPSPLNSPQNSHVRVPRSAAPPVTAPIPQPLNSPTQPKANVPPIARSPQTKSEEPKEEKEEEKVSPFFQRLKGKFNLKSLFSRDEVEPPQTLPQTIPTTRKQPKKKDDVKPTPIHLDVPFFVVLFFVAAKLLALLPNGLVLLDMHVWLYIGVGLGFLTLYHKRIPWLEPILPKLWYVILAYVIRILLTL